VPAEGEDTVLVVSGGVAPGELTGIRIPAARRVIAADSGVATAFELGLHVDELIGDLDSAPAPLQARVVDSGGRLRRHPVDKDATDLELALAAAVTQEPPPRRVIVLGGTGGRLDHLVAGVLLLAAPTWAGADATGTHVEAWLGRAKITVVRRSVVLGAAAPGELLSLLAVGGVAHGVTATGLRYELTGADLTPGTSLGVSNQFVGRQATVAVSAGVVLAIQPGESGQPGENGPVTRRPPDAAGASHRRGGRPAGDRRR
jgi:thiamine pyrophosphokinase